MNIFKARTAEHIRTAQCLFREYEAELGVDLCFQNFAEELAGLPGKYGPPEGSLLLAEVGGCPAGCVAMRRLDDSSCEMKRLFVRPAYRGQGLGRILAGNIIQHARVAGYGTMYLDTLSGLENARNLYRSLGFREAGAYYHNPLEGVVYLQLDLRT